MTAKKTLPASLDDAVALLEAAGEELQEKGYVPKYTDDELRAMAGSGAVPNERFVVRFSPAPIDKKTGKLISPEENEGPIGMMRDSGRHPLWMSTFDQVERCDTDAKVIADVFGTYYDPNKDYVLYILVHHNT